MHPSHEKSGESLASLALLTLGRWGTAAELVRLREQPVMRLGAHVPRLTHIAGLKPVTSPVVCNPFLLPSLHEPHRRGIQPLDRPSKPCPC
jgi:hypothetical protein